MKYKIGETVLLLDTEFKPAYSAVVRDYNTASYQYEVEYQHPSSDTSEIVWVSQERLTVATDIINSLNRNLKK
jgi:hypothetical protein